MSLSDGCPGSPNIAANDGGDSKIESAIQSSGIQDSMTQQTSETETTATTSAIGSLATIHEQTDSSSAEDECVTEKATSGNVEFDKTIESETSDGISPDELTNVLSSPEPGPVADHIADNEPAKLDLQPDESLFHSSPPEAAITTNPASVVSAEGTVELDHSTSVGQTDVAPNDSAKSKDNKFVDPNDKANIGTDVIKFFYTASTRRRRSSPVASAPGCCNPRLHRDSDLYIKARGEDGKVYVFEVVSATLEKASPKFEAMIYGSHTRGNKEEWVWELDDNP
jgi:hypothetical protein